MSQTGNGWPRPWGWADVKKAKDAQSAFAPSRAAERAYERQLASVAGQVAEVIARNEPEQAAKLLRDYAKVLEPWAEQSAANMLFGVRKKNDQAWRAMAARMGREAREIMAGDGVGRVVRERIQENVALIKSLALDAAADLTALIQKNVSGGLRAEQLAAEISSIAGSSLPRARTIARTEVSKAGAAMTMARAMDVGSEGYIWRTTRDGLTRASHRAMEGKFVRWDSPPTIDGMTGHAGEFPNCRCYPEPVIRNDAGKVIASPLPTAEHEEAAGQKTLFSTWEQQPASSVIPHTPGASLVGVDKAVFDADKLTRYSLDPDSPRGKEKARVFKAALGLEKRHAELVEKQIMALLPELPAVRQAADKYGERFKVLVPVTGPNGKTVDVATSWIYDRHKDGRRMATKPRLATIYIPKD